MCDCLEPFQSTEVFIETLKQRTGFLKTTTNYDVTGVYVGIEFCSRFLDRNDLNYYLNNCNTIKKMSLNISYVVPPLEEQEINMEKLKTLFELLNAKMINEVIFNDLGSIAWFRTFDYDVPIRLGRLFDKSVREVRFYVDEYTKMENKNILFKPIFFDDFYGKLFLEYNIKGFDLDTVPFDKLEINDQYSGVIGIHYPRIVLARSYFCEYAMNLGEPLVKKCNYDCKRYLKKLTLKNDSIVYLDGNVLVIFQKENFHNNIITNNNIRMIYSGGENEYNCTC